MDKKTRKELIGRFGQALEERLPQFRIHKKKVHSPTWVWPLAPNLTFFVMLQPNSASGYDEFFVELAWSEDDQFPWQISLSGHPSVEAPCWRVRLAELWATGPLADSWRIITDATKAELQRKEAAYKRGDIDEWLEPVRKVPEEEVLPLVAPLAEDAVEKLVEFGMPLFRKVAEHRGIPWPGP